MKKLAYFFALFLLLSPSISSAIPLLCSEVLSGASIQAVYNNIPYKLIRNAKSFIEPSHIWSDYSTTDIIIGFTAGHTYLYVNGNRYDGGLALNGHKSEIRKSHFVSDGILLRIKNAPPEILENLSQDFENRRKSLSLTCSHGVCNFLNRNGFDLPKAYSLIPSVFVTEILKNGMKTSSGEKLTFDLTVAGTRSFENSMKQNRTAEVILTVMSPITTIVSLLLVISSIENSSKQLLSRLK